ncbi:MAG: hypothetical protein RIR43_1878 [Pseudomonadota bacterium]|jgi:carboxypeptidase Q
MMNRRHCLARALALMGLPASATVGLGGCASPGPSDHGAVFAAADIATARRLIEEARSSGEAWRLARELAVDIGARPAGSAGDRRAVAWAQQALRGLGLQKVRTQAIDLNIWQRGRGSARLHIDGHSAIPGPRDLVMAALGNSISTPIEGLEAEVAWYPTLAALMEEPADPSRGRAAGRIVFIDQRTERTRDGSGYGRSVGARLNGPVEAARRGAIAFGLRSVGTSGGALPEGAPTNAQRDAQRIAHTGATRYDLRVQPIPAFAVSMADADVMAQAAAQGRAMRLRLQMDNRSGVPAVTHNVMGEIPGTDLAHEVVLIGAHLDSWDLGQGAVDDGAGVAIVSAAAGLIAQHAREGRSPRRTVRVVLFANEENGFDGAIAYGKAYSRVPHQVVAESDFGGGRIYRLSSRVQPAALPLFAQMAELLKPLGLELGDNQGNPGPDAAFLMRNHQWPGLQLSQDGTRYFDVHHTERDTIDQLDAADLQQNVACWATVAWLSAQAPVGFAPLPALRR